MSEVDLIAALGAPAAQAFGALRDHRLKCFWCVHVFGCRRSDRLHTAYHLAVTNRVEATR